MNTRIIYLIGLALILTACSIHKIDIQQGNVLDCDIIGQVQPGMTRNQVQFLLGNPAIRHPFDHKRWDYPFQFRSGKKGTPLEHDTLTVFFTSDDLVEKIVTTLACTNN